MSMIGNFLAISEEKASELRSNQSKIPDYLYSDEVQESNSLLDVDKAWHGVHFLLTGSTWEGEVPLCWVVLGGEAIGEDIGYGPARLVNTEEVKQINEAISSIDTSVLNARYDAVTLNKAEIYPDGWGPDDAEYVIGAFQKIKIFYSSAAEKNQCVIQFLN